MMEQELKQVWQDLKKIWNNSSQADKINFPVAGLMIDLKAKISKFEMDSINRDITKISTSIKRIINQLRNKK